MTSNTDGAAQGEWTAEDSGEDWQLWEGDVPIGWAATQARAKQIIADHRKVQAADVLAKALQEIGCVSISDTPCSERTDGYEGCTRCAALAQYRAATEEATR